MGKRSFICRSSLGVNGSLHVDSTFCCFWFFVVLCWCFDLWGYCLSPKTCFFSKWFMFQGLWSMWNLHFLIIFWYMWYFLGLYLSLFWYFCTGFCLGISAEDVLFVQYVSCTRCIFLRNIGKHDMCSGQQWDIMWCYIFRSYCSSNLYGVWTSNAVLTFFFYISHISQTIQHRYRWYCLLNILEYFCHFKFQFSFFVYVMIKL